MVCEQDFRKHRDWWVQATALCAILLVTCYVMRDESDPEDAVFAQLLRERDAQSFMLYSARDIFTVYVSYAHLYLIPAVLPMPAVISI